MNEDQHTRRSVARAVLWTTLALLLLLGVSAAASVVHLGRASLPVALGVAGLKGAIVALWFMQLRHERASVRLTAAAGFFWLALLIVGTLADVLTRSTPTVTLPREDARAAPLHPPRPAP